MAEMVKVFLLGRRAYQATPQDKSIQYPQGLVEMPYEHAAAMGLLRRIVKEVPRADDPEKVDIVRVPFEGAFDEKLTQILVNGGYKTLGDVKIASQDQLMALEGIGPANYERIQAAVGRGPLATPAVGAAQVSAVDAEQNTGGA